MSPRHESPDAEIVRRAVAGDVEAFTCLVRHFWGRLFRWLRGLTGSTVQAEDLTQEAFLRAWRGLGTFRPGADFRAWLFSIARHEWIDAHKKARVKTVPPLSDELPGREPDPAVLVEERELDEQFRQACGRLPKVFRAAFLLWSQEGMSFAQIGEVCGIAEATARWRVFKARHMLVRLLGDCRGETLR
jgi:RNA polymerase sigma-70 factor (ECF subfamily)